ncbi:glucosamine-6-phosphate deaminase [Williamsoniiplasma luminosum]|uniref:Glucosamine-6-phosphate deaminase n=1 Tax=Williamsoniiplasma luminosum TaxID=214888 RepID=A0A2S0NK73_9MOLU|nr:glucosamine-6-phosphate deaminase [Williamsoniiplasma luminosum]AVP49402.1 MAG: glucosamine-6-phosphate deaminase [Williamsoniiplasma luminosum]
MKIIKVKNNQEAGIQAAQIILEKIHANPGCILGLATGSTPITTYQNLIKAYEHKQVSFKDVITFNLDEYKGLNPTNPQSYRFFMNNELFDHIDIKIENTHVPSGLHTQNPALYDQKIHKAGGIDLQLLGLGVNGHIGFNEPGTAFDSLTHVVDLDPSTIAVNARFFDSIDLVPTQAISMGLKTIMNAKQILLIATGANKAEAIAHLINGEITPNWPCSILQQHPNVVIIIDEAAGSLLK